MLALSVMVSIMVVPARAVDPVTIARPSDPGLGRWEPPKALLGCKRN